MKNRIFLTIALLSSATSFNAYAQTTPNPPSAKPAKIEVVQEGELRLDGKVTGLLGANQWTLNAFAFTSPRGVTKEFDEPKNKTIKIPPTTYIHPLGEEGKVNVKDVKIGSLIAVIGKSGPENSLIAREIVLLEGYGQRKTVGTLTVNPFSGALIDQSRKARDAGQTAKALDLALKAAAGAQGIGDKSGEALSTRDAVLLYLESQQFQQALDASLQVERLGQEIGNEMAIALGLSGKGDALGGLGKTPEALKAYEESASYAARASNQLNQGVLSRLATAYLGAGQFDNAIKVLEKVAPVETALGLPDDAAQSRLMIGLFRADDDVAGAKIELANGEQALTNLANPDERGNLLSALALLQWRLGQKGDAKARLEEAAKFYEGQNKSKQAAAMRQISTYLETAPNTDAGVANAILGKFTAPPTQTPQVQ